MYPSDSIPIHVDMKIGSLFAGIGGIDLGFEQAGFTTAWANEIDADACKTYRINFPSVMLMEGDIRQIDPCLLRPVDVLTAGFPCQPFSVCGKKEGFKDARGNLFFEIMRFCDALMPPVIFLENVANLTDHDNGRTFITIHNELVSREYSIRYIMADTCDYGIPQHRTRTYLVAFQDQEMCDRFVFPDKCQLEKTIFDVIDKTIRAKDRYYISEDSYEYRRLSSAITDDNQIYRFADYGIQAGKDGISFTLKANMGTWKNRVPYIKDDFGIREITPYECLALQGFPKDFKFPDIPIMQAYKQCGNTVCVPIVKSIARQIIRIIT